MVLQSVIGAIGITVPLGRKAGYCFAGNSDRLVQGIGIDSV